MWTWRPRTIAAPMTQRYNAVRMTTLVITDTVTSSPHNSVQRLRLCVIIAPISSCTSISELTVRDLGKATAFQDLVAQSGWTRAHHQRYGYYWYPTHTHESLRTLDSCIAGLHHPYDRPRQKASTYG